MNRIRAIFLVPSKPWTKSPSLWERTWCSWHAAVLGMSPSYSRDNTGKDLSRHYGPIIRSRHWSLQELVSSRDSRVTGTKCPWLNISQESMTSLIPGLYLTMDILPSFSLGDFQLQEFTSPNQRQCIAPALWHD